MTVALQGTPTDTETSSGTSVAAAYPTGVAAGEVLLAHVAVGATTIQTTAPTGWTFVASRNGSASLGPSDALFYRVADGTETGSVTFTPLTAAARITVIMERWSGVDNTTPLDVTTVTGVAAAAAATYTTPTITTVTANAVIVYQVSINAASANDITLASGVTLVQDSSGTGKREMIGYETQAAAGASAARTWGISPSTALDWTSVVAALRPAAGGTNVSDTPADALGLTDSAAAVWDRQAAPADTVGLTDSATVNWDRAAAPADNVGLTDAATVNLDRQAAPADALGLTDSAAAVWDRQQAPADQLGLTDTVTAQADRLAASADQLGITDAVTVVWDRAVNVADPVGITDSVASSGTGGQTFADTVGITDAVTVQADRQAAPADPVTLTDTATVNFDRQAVQADLVGVTDSVAVTADRAAAFADPLSLTDSVSVSLARQQTVADPVGITDSVSVSWGRVYTIADSLGISDAGQSSGFMRDLALKLSALQPRFSLSALLSRFAEASLLRFSLALQLPRFSTAVLTRFTTAPLGGIMTTTIHVTKGEKQYAGGTVTETTGKDLTAATFQVSLGSSDVPGTAAVPDKNQAGATNNVRTVAKLIDNTVPVGRYWVWIHVGDSPENVLIPAQEIIVA